MYLVRKPGFAIFGALVTAGVNLLLGSPYGLQLVLAGFLEGLAVEIGYGVVDKYQGSMKNLLLSGILDRSLCCAEMDSSGELPGAMEEQ